MEMKPVTFAPNYLVYIILKTITLLVVLHLSDVDWQTQKLEWKPTQRKQKKQIVTQNHIYNDRIFTLFVSYFIVLKGHPARSEVEWFFFYHRNILAQIGKMQTCPSK